MCLMAWRWAPDTDTPLLWAANRDEFAHRATAPLQRWVHGGHTVFSGLDLALEPQDKLLGTWSGITSTGRFAWLTNVRSPNDKNPEAPSRGHLVSRYLCSTVSPEAYLAELRSKANRYNGFNLVLGQLSTTVGASECWHFNSRNTHPRHAAAPLKAGVYGLSNASLDSPWPKTRALVQALALQAASVPPNTAPQAAHQTALLAALANRSVYPADILPQTGLPIELEQVLSAAFIAAPLRGAAYGTRSSTVGWVHHQSLTVVERSFNAQGVPTTEVRLHEHLAAI